MAKSTDRATRVALALLNHLAEGPTDDLRSVRCFRTSQFRSLLLQLNEGRQRPSGVALEASLRQLGYVRPLRVDVGRAHRPKDAFMMAGLHNLGPPSAEELLQVWSPSGVLAYFTAISIHQLSTQIPPYCVLVETRSPTPTVRPEAPQKMLDHNGDQRHRDEDRPARGEDDRARHQRQHAIGQLAFTYEGMPHYISERQLPLRHSQDVVLHPLTTGTVTTVAQTLADTLRHPIACGGPAVIVEAWENGFDIADLGELDDCLGAWGDDELDARRLGWLCESLNLELPPALAARVDAACANLAQARIAPLFQGLNVGAVDDRWRLRVAQ